MSRPSWEAWALALAQAAATRSTCNRLAVGACVIGSSRRVIAVGYNGARPGEPACDPAACYVGGPPCARTVHAEANALRYTTGDTAGATLVVSHSPCEDCLRLAARAGVRRVAYGAPYRGLERSVTLARELGLSLGPVEP